MPALSDPEVEMHLFFYPRAYSSFNLNKPFYEFLY